METVIRDRQETYYRVLAEADRRSDATVFIEFMLQALDDALREAVSTDQVTDQVSKPLQRIIAALGKDELSVAAFMAALGLSHRPTFRQNYLNPDIADGWVAPTRPDSPRSPTLRYRLTLRGRRWLDGS